MERMSDVLMETIGTMLAVQVFSNPAGAQQGTCGAVNAAAQQDSGTQFRVSRGSTRRSRRAGLIPIKFESC